MYAFFFARWRIVMGWLVKRSAARFLESGLAGVALTALCCGGLLWRRAASAQAPQKYQATIESLDRHELPAWDDQAKLGIFVHWGLYSVPGWAPLAHPNHDFSSQDYITNNPYAEWY